MDANLFLMLAAGVLIACGAYLILDRVLTRVLMGLLLLGNGINLLMLQAGGQAGSPPILGRQSSEHGDTLADPLAQGMILTAIVISMAMTAFVLTLIYRQYRYRTADVIDDDFEDTSVAARAADPLAIIADDDSGSDKAGPSTFEEPVTGGGR